MGTIEVSQLLSYLVPALIAYNVWLHNQIVKAQIEIAVNTSKDNDIMEQFKELKQKFDKMYDEIHSYMIERGKNNG